MLVISLPRMCSRMPVGQPGCALEGPFLLETKSQSIICQASQGWPGSKDEERALFSTEATVVEETSGTHQI